MINLETWYFEEDLEDLKKECHNCRYLVEDAVLLDDGCYERPILRCDYDREIFSYEDDEDDAPCLYRQVE